jgi:16S rRNA (guanine527-N7)-methyltransferase
VGIKTLPFADAIHFADSIHGCKIIYDNDKNITTLCDIGSGGGFPGLVFAIMYPKINVVLIDIDKRKIEFLKQTVKALELTNVSFLDKNVETLPDDSIDCAVSRGFAPIPNTIMVARKIVKKGGRYYHFKNEQWASEIAIIPTQLCSLWAPSLVSEYKLPIGDAKFSIIKTDKIG